MSARLCISDVDIVSAYRVLSAASGRPIVNTRRLGACLGMHPPTLYCRLRRLGLPTNKSGGSRARPPSTMGRGKWASRRPPLGLTPACDGTRLSVLRVARTIEACTGRGVVLSAAAGACGVTRQRVHQIIDEFRAYAPEQPAAKPVDPA